MLVNSTFLYESTRSKVVKSLRNIHWIVNKYTPMNTIKKVWSIIKVHAPPPLLLPITWSHSLLSLAIIAQVKVKEQQIKENTNSWTKYLKLFKPIQLCKNRQWWSILRQHSLQVLQWWVLIGLMIKHLSQYPLGY